MKKLYTMTLSIALMVSGCCGVPQEALDQAHTNATICDAFVQQMDAGNTSREQEQEFIKSNRKAWHAQDHVLNDAELPADMQPAKPTE